MSGRASHVTKLRSEFDTGQSFIEYSVICQVEIDSWSRVLGADWDLTDCTPGDLDPHAVASVFKAYLREREYHVSFHYTRCS